MKVTIRNRKTGLYIGSKPGSFNTTTETEATTPREFAVAIEGAISEEIARTLGPDYEVVDPTGVWSNVTE